MLEVFGQLENEADFETYEGRELDPDLALKVKRAGKGTAAFTLSAAMITALSFGGAAPSAFASVDADGSGVIHTEVQENPIAAGLRGVVKATVKRDSKGKPQIVEAPAPAPIEEIVEAPVKAEPEVVEEVAPAPEVPQPVVEELAKASAPADGGAGGLVRGLVKGSMGFFSQDDVLTAPSIGGEEVEEAKGDVEAVSAESSVEKPPATIENIDSIDINQYKFADMSNSNWVLLTQRKLDSMGYSIPRTGTFGPLTKTAIMRFQFDHGMPATGVVNTETKLALMDGQVPSDGDRIQQRKPLILWSAQEILSGEDLHNGRGRSEATYINSVPVISHQYMRDLGKGPRAHRGVDLPLPKGHKVLAVGTQAQVWYDDAGGGLVIEQTHPSMPGTLIQVLHANSAFGESWSYYKANGKKTFDIDPAEVGRRVIGEVGNTGLGQGAHTHIGVKMLDGNRYGQDVQSGAENFIMVRSTLPHLLHWGFEQDIHVAMGEPAYEGSKHSNRLDVAAVPNISDVQALKGEVVAPAIEPPPHAEVEVQAEAPAPAVDNYIPVGGKVRDKAAEHVMSDPRGAMALVDVANHMGLDPIEFVALMSWESGGTLNPNALGGDRDEYKGLIQFSPSNAKKYGVDGQVSIADYAPAVMEYMQDRGFKPGEHDIRHAYSSILVGTANENYRHPTTGKYAWDIPDSNTTTVRNAAKYFQEGSPHHARAKAFLEASLGEVPGKAKTAAELREEEVAAQLSAEATPAEEGPLTAKEGSGVMPGQLNGEESVEQMPSGIFERLRWAFTAPTSQSFKSE